MSRVCLPSQDLAIAHTSDTHLGDPYGHPESKTALRKVVDKVSAELETSYVSPCFFRMVLDT